MKAKNIKNTMLFGTNIQNFAPIEDAGGSIIVIKESLNSIYSIQIEGKTYGGLQGGNTSVTAKLPPDGSFYIQELRGKIFKHGPQAVLTYIKATIDDDSVEIGGKTNESDTILQGDLKVRFSGIYYGASSIYGILFELIPQ